MEEYYTMAEVAKALKLSVPSIRRYLREGILEGAKYGREWRFSEEQVKALHEYGTQQAREMMAAEREAKEKKRAVKQSGGEGFPFTEPPLSPPPEPAQGESNEEESVSMTDGAGVSLTGDAGKDTASAGVSNPPKTEEEEPEEPKISAENTPKAAGIAM